MLNEKNQNNKTLLAKATGCILRLNNCSICESVTNGYQVIEKQ